MEYIMGIYTNKYGIWFIWDYNGIIVFIMGLYTNNSG